MRFFFFLGLGWISTGCYQHCAWIWTHRWSRSYREYGCWHGDLHGVNWGKDRPMTLFIPSLSLGFIKQITNYFRANTPLYRDYTQSYGCLKVYYVILLTPYLCLRETWVRSGWSNKGKLNSCGEYGPPSPNGHITLTVSYILLYLLDSDIV